MGDKAKDIWSKIKGFLGKLGKKLWIIIAVVVLVVAGIIIFVSVQSAKNPWAVLFTEMTPEDMQSVTTYLASAGVTDYRVQGDDTILVRSEQEPSLKASLLMEGYPESGFGYKTYLDNVGSLSTESDRAQMALYDLQDRLGATIRCLEGVKDARVIITTGEDRRYVLGQDDILKASAAVTVTMKGDDEISKKLVAAIRSLVSRSVQGLEMEEISIVDSLGNTYDGADLEDENATSTDVQYALEEQYNRKIRKSVLDVLTPMFGEENVSVGVNTTVEMSRAVEDETEYTLPEYAQDGNTNGEGIVGRKIWSGRIVRDDEAAGGVVGTGANADLNTYVEEAPVDGSEQELEVEGDKTYLVDTLHTQRELMAGTISDVMVSVTINSDVPNLADADALLSHVGRAAGITANQQAEKISIISHPFYVKPVEDNNKTVDGPVTILSGIPDWVLYALAAGLLLFMILFFMLLMMRRKKNQAVLEEAPVMQIMPEAVADIVEPEPEPEGADIMEVHVERSMELRRGVREFAEQNPEIAAQMVKSWLKGDDDGHGTEN